MTPPTLSEPAQPNSPSLRSRLWRVLRWIPMTIILLTGVILLIMLLSGGLTKITAWYLLQIVPPVLGLLALISIVIYAIARRRLSKPVLISGVVSLLALAPAMMMIRPIAYPASITAMQPAATVRLPADVPLTVIWGGDDIATNQHAAFPDQRWAYDFLIPPYLSGSSRLEDYGCYGVPVVAPIAGEVVVAQDGEPDETPGILSNNMQAPKGNHVVIKLATGTFLIIAHFKQGSVTVKPGQFVEEGQVIGQCGNSGNTSEPHIHIHHQLQDPAIYPINFAEGLPLYFRDHDGDPMPRGGVKIEGGKPIVTGAVVRHIGKRTQGFLNEPG